MAYQILGYGYAWWRGDPRPIMTPLSGFRATVSNDYASIATLAQLPVEEIDRHVRDGNQPYIAYIGGQPAAYGWSAAKEGSIQELDLTFAIPPDNRYLWDFMTLPPWRGRGIYPRLLQAIIDLEGASIHRFWIGRTADNIASRRGIEKAGFQEVERLVASPSGSLHIVATGTTACAEVSPMGLHLGVMEG